MNAATETRVIEKIAAQCIKQATSRFPPTVWGFMAPDIAADVKVAFAVQQAVSESTTWTPEKTGEHMRAIVGEIQRQVYG